MWGLCGAQAEFFQAFGVDDRDGKKPLQSLDEIVSFLDKVARSGLGGVLEQRETKSFSSAKPLLLEPVV